MDSCTLMCVLSAAAALVVAVVVLLWTVQRSGAAPIVPRNLFDYCPACGAALRGGARDCPECDLDLTGKFARRLERMRTTRLEVRQLQEEGALSEEVAGQVVEQLHLRKEALLGRRRQPAPEVLRPVLAPPPLPARPDTYEVQPAEEPPFEAELEVTPPAAPPPLPRRTPAFVAPPRRSLAEAFGEFMHVRNILWGELAGGLLIVGCSVALVLSLWRTLEELPYFTFLLSAGITAAVFGAGHYTLHHWKLAVTSRGLLVIAVLLTPLNLLLLGDLGARGTADALDMAVKVGAVLGFAWLIRTGGRDLVEADSVSRRWWLALALVGAPASQMAPALGDAGAIILQPVWLSLACFAAASAAVIGRMTRSRRSGEPAPLTEDTAMALLLFVGLTVFALGATWGFVLSRADDLPATLRHMALPTVLAGMPLLAAGLLVQRGVKESVGLRATGTGVAVAGMLVLSASLALAWPAPLTLLVVAAAVGLLLGWTAYRDEMPWLYAAAIPCAACAAVLGFHVVADGLAVPDGVDPARWLRGRFTAASSGAALVGYASILWALSAWLDRRGRLADALCLVAGAAGSAVVALLVVTVHGPEQPMLAAGVHLACAAGFIVASLRWRYRVVSLFGVWLLIPATLWFLWAVRPDHPGVWGLAVGGEALVLALTALSLPRLPRLRDACRDVAGAAGLLSLAFPLAGGLLSVAFPIFAGGSLRDPETSGILFLAAATAFVLATLYRERGLVWAGSLVGLLALAQVLTFPLGVETWRLAVLLALLVHATTALGSATLIQRANREDESARWLGLFTEPLRYSARLTSCLAVPFMIVPDAGLAALWAAFAAWVGVLWLASSFVWKDRGAFPAFQVALTWAAGLLGFAWVERQEWFPGPLGVIDPRALQAYGLAVAVLSVGWELARQFLRPRAIVSDLWDSVRPSADRVVLAALVAGQLLLAAGGLLPFVVAELTPAGAAPVFYPLAEAGHVWGLEAWLLLGCLAVALTLACRRESGGPISVAGFTLLALTVPFLLAGSFTPDIAAASALRWGLAVVFLLGSAVAAWLQPSARRPAGLSPQSLVWLRGLIAAGAAVVLLLTMHVAMLGLSGQSPTGPAAESVFRQMGWTASMTVPLAMIVVGLALTAWWERSAGYAFAGGLVWIGTVAGGYALGVVTGGGTLDAAEQMRVALLAVGAGAAWALAWLGVERRIPGRGLLTGMIGASVAGLAVLCLIPFSHLMAFPFKPLGPASTRLGSDGWAAALLAFAAAFWHTKPVWRTHVVSLFAVLAGLLAACSAAPWDDVGEWLSFHVLGIAWAAAGVALAAVSPRSDWGRSTARWLEVLALGLILIGLRGGWADPWPWAPAAETVVAAALLAAVAVRSRSPLHEYAAGMTAALAGALMWVSWGPDTAASLALAVAAGLSVAGMAFSLVRGPRGRNAQLPPFSLTAAAVGVMLLLLGLLPTWAGSEIDPPLLAWGALVAVGGACALLRREPDTEFRWPGVYVVGAAAIGLALAEARPGPVWLDWPTPLALAGYIVAAAVVTRQFAVPRWLLALQSVTAALVLGMAARTAAAEADILHRLAAPLAAGLLVVAAALLVRRAGTWEVGVRRVTLGLGMFAAGLLAWAIPDPAGAVPWLDRHAGLFVTLAATAVIYLNLRPAPATATRPDDFRGAGGISGALALVMLAVVLTQQIPQFDPVLKKTPLDPLAVGAVLAAILGLLALAIQCALRPGRDPLGPTAHGRAGYVYLAEALLVLAFAHVRLNVPQVFTGQAVRYWTFIVMILAFVGVGLAELFARRGLRVLSRPLLRTGALLPLIPLLAFWAKPPGAVMEFADTKAPGLRPMLGYLEKLPQHFDVYAALWFLAGLLYGLVALSRRSFGWALLGALATNAGLWALLSHNGIPAAVHPQVWAVPLALIVLVSEFVNRHRLRPEAASGLRYLGVSMIYVASASDLFIAGIGQSVWLPVALAAWCFAGILAGMWFRVRAFLYLGVGFMALDVFAMIWHAAVDRKQPWVWYASGIVLGIAILALFAVLEKRRNAVRGLADELREWD